MEKLIIKNRKDQKIVVVLEKQENQKGLVFVMHGLGGFKEQPHVQTFKEAFREESFTTILFDSTNTLGESEGKYEEATTTNYFEDLEDVIEWAKTQDFYEEPFWLIGHSLGGISVALYAENFPEKVKGVAPISPVVSGKLSVETERYGDGEVIKKWKETGWMIRESKSKPGVIKKLKWSHMEDRLKYNLLEKVNKLIMPVLIIVGEKDEGTPPEHQKILFDAIPTEKKELHIIKDAPHTFREKVQLEEIKKLIKNWIEKYT